MPAHFVAVSQSKTSALAIWSLVLGILSPLCCTCFTGIPAVICGHMALSKIRRSGGALTGRNMAIAGLVTGYLGIAVIAIFVILEMLGIASAIAIPNFIKASQVH